MGLDLDLSYSKVAFKASHDSYERDELPISTQFGDLGDKPWEGRCRGVELDLNPSGRNWMWSVRPHRRIRAGPPISGSCYLADLARWHGDHPDHHVITVTLDLKDGGPLDEKVNAQSELARQSDATLAHSGDAVFRLATFAAVTRRCSRARTGQASRGSPAGSSSSCRAAASSNLRRGRWRRRLLLHRPEILSRRQVHAGVHAQHRLLQRRHGRLDAAQRRALAAGAPRHRRNGRCIVRGYGINSAQTWTAARDAGLSMLSTDKVKGYEWATVGDDPFMPRLGAVPRVPWARSRAQGGFAPRGRASHSTGGSARAQASGVPAARSRHEASSGGGTRHGHRQLI